MVEGWPIRIVIRANFDLCTGCSICRLACSERHTGGYNPRLALLQIRHVNEGLVHEPVVCRQCRNAYCQTVCPAEAIGRDKKTGAVIVDRDKCTGCGLCVKYCYLGAVRLDKGDKKAVKCDLCGGDPACVKDCPTGALEVVQLGGEKDNA